MIQYLSIPLSSCLPRLWPCGWNATLASWFLAVNAGLITVHHTLASAPSAQADASYFMVTRHEASLENKSKPLEMTMKTILSAIVALSFVAGTVAPAAAYEGFSIKTLDQDGRGGHVN